MNHSVDAVEGSGCSRLQLSDMAALIVNYRTPELSGAAVESCTVLGMSRILVVDNGPEHENPDAMRTELTSRSLAAAVLQSDENLGFAGGVNFGMVHLLRDEGWQYVLLLNSDACLTPTFVASWASARSDPSLDIVCGQIDVMRDSGGTEVESIGMTLHRSLLASERRTEEDGPLLGPTGACVVLSRRLVERVIDVHGELLCSAFFCYAEDTDLFVRTRLLGFVPVVLSGGAIAHHKGQASSDGKNSDFVFFHGIRNSLWMQIRSVPGRSLLLCLPWMVLGQIGVFVKAVFDRRFRLLIRIYWETFAALPLLLRQRLQIQRNRTLAPREFQRLISRHLYDRRYIAETLRKLMRARDARG